MSGQSSSRLLLTRRALRDIREIREYSTREWGKRTAEKYLDDLEAGLERLKSNPGLLRAEPDLHPALTFYLVNKHLIVCDVQAKSGRRPKSIVVLTVLHASMDLPTRLAELQPTLAAEVEILHRKLRRGKGKKS